MLLRIVVILLFAGCADPDPPVDCDALAVRASAAVRDAVRARAALTGCVADADCVIGSDAITCPESGTWLGGCGIAIRADQQDALQSVIDDVAAELVCSSDATCRAGPSCAPVEPACEGGRCVSVVQLP